MPHTKPPPSPWVLAPSSGRVRVERVGSCNLSPAEARELSALFAEIAARADCGALADERETFEAA